MNWRAWFWSSSFTAPLLFSTSIPTIWDINFMVMGHRPVRLVFVGTRPFASMHLWQLHGSVKMAYCISTGDRCLHSSKPEFAVRPFPMKNPYDVLRIKEQELLRVRKEMDALRIAARLMGAEDPGAANGEGQPKLQRVVEMP